MQNRLFQTSQTGGQRYSDTSPFSIPCSNTLAYFSHIQHRRKKRFILVKPDFCATTFARGINWNKTRTGDVAIVPCPNGATGLARWACQEDGRWASPGANLAAHPDLRDCKSAAMANLEARVREEDPEDVVVSSLAHLVSIS